MKNKKPLFGMIAAPLLLALYLTYLRYVDYPINWLLVVFLTMICMAVPLFILFLRGTFSRKAEK